MSQHLSDADTTQHLTFYRVFLKLFMITFITGGYAIKVEPRIAVYLTMQFEIEALKIEISRISQNIFYKFQLINKRK